MNPLIGAGLIAGGGNLLGSIGNMIFGANQAGQNRTWQERMYERQFQDYNELAVAERLKKLGLSPGAIADALGAHSTAAAATPGSGAQAAAPNMGNLGDSIVNAMRTVYENQLTKAQAEKTTEETKYIPKYYNLTAKDVMANTNLKYAQKMDLLNQIKKRDEEIKQINKEMQLTDKDIKLQEKIIAWYDRKTEAEIDEINTRIKNFQEQTENLKEDKKEKRWRNFWRDEFGFSSEDPILNIAVQAAVKGDLTKIMESLVKTKAAFFTTNENIEKKLKKSQNTIEQHYMKNYGPDSDWYKEKFGEMKRRHEN